MTPLRNEKGMVLLLVLAVVALLSALLVEFAFSTLVDMRLTETFRDSTRAWYLAKGGVQAGRMILKEDLKLTKIDHLGEFWGQEGLSYPVRDELVVSITITDANRKININRMVDANGNPNVVVQDQLTRLMNNLGISNPNVLTDSLIDWIDQDSATRTDGAEASYYQSLEEPYPVKNGKLDDLEELLKVRGFTRDIFELLAEHVTVYGNGQININTAAEDVLMAADPLIDRSRAEQIVSRRSTEPFKDTAGLNAVPGLATLLRTPFSVTSDIFTVVATAEVGDEGGRRTATAVVDHSGAKVSYLRVD